MSSVTFIKTTNAIDNGSDIHFMRPLIRLGLLISQQKHSAKLEGQCSLWLNGAETEGRPCKRPFSLHMKVQILDTSAGPCDCLV